MSLQSTQYMEVDQAGPPRRIAWRQTAARAAGAPGLLWLNGFTSTMMSTKVLALADWCEARGLGLTRFDYTGHGESDGDFAAATIGLWLADAAAAFEQLTRGPQILVGSSMGGWIAMLLLRRHLAQLAPGKASRITGLVMIAPALDLTEDLIWNKLDGGARRILEETGMLMRSNDQGEPQAPITRAFIEEGRQHLLAPEGFAPRCPVRILQGRADDIVPWRHALRTLDLLHESDCEFLLVKDGDHRLSRPQDIVRLIRMIEGLLPA